LQHFGKFGNWCHTLNHLPIMSNSLKKKPLSTTYFSSSCFVTSYSTLCFYGSICKRPPPSLSSQHPTTCTSSGAFGNVKLPRNQSYNEHSPQQQPLIKEKCPAKKKTAIISYDMITRSDPMWNTKNDASVLPTTDEATIQQTINALGAQCQAPLGMSYIISFLFHYCFNLLGTGLCIIPAMAYLDFMLHYLFSFSARIIMEYNCFTDLMSDLLWTLDDPSSSIALQKKCEHFFILLVHFLINYPVDSIQVSQTHTTFIHLMLTIPSGLSNNNSSKNSLPTIAFNNNDRWTNIPIQSSQVHSLYTHTGIWPPFAMMTITMLLTLLNYFNIIGICQL